jgi:hypothetical protein
MEEQPKLQSLASPEQAANRARLVELFEASPLPVDELLVNLALYMRSSVVAKLLYVDELYREIVRIPGAIMEFGVWWGANLALFESLRAVHEPYNHTRRVVGFDTFGGYSAPAPEDGSSELVGEGRYAVSEDYVEHLDGVLEYHRHENPTGHIPKHQLRVGDAAAELERHLAEHPETIVALAYFDMQLYEPTKRCLELLRPHLVRGSVIAMDELNSQDFPGETLAYREAIGLDRHRLVRSRFLPDRTYAIVD